MYNNASIDLSEPFLSYYPYHVMLEFWVEARNQLGKTESDRVNKVAQSFGETFFC